MKKALLFVLLAISMTAFGQVRPTVSILGDSYSTFEGFIPKANEIWYFKTPPQNRTDVTKVTQTWWWQVIKDGGYKLGVNNSWSGATISNTGYRDEDYTVRSFTTRDTQLGNPDIILVCGGTNDSWAGVKMGEYQYKDWTRGDLYYFRPAMAKLLVDLSEHYPNVPVYFILNSDLRKEVNESVETVCKHYNVPVIKLHDIDKQNGHPSIKGMKAFADQVLAVIGKAKVQ